MNKFKEINQFFTQIFILVIILKVVDFNDLKVIDYVIITLVVVYFGLILFSSRKKE
jgi:hypothetical protein